MINSAALLHRDTWVCLYLTNQGVPGQVLMERRLLASSNEVLVC